jgi:outer membrane protein OmpA-like peptidoglycan-associated protein
MKKTLFILLILPILSFAQKKDYKSFDKAVKYNTDGNIEKSIKYANKALENSPGWSKPNLLLASIYANDKQIELAAEYLLKVYNTNNLKDVKGIEQVVKLYYYNGFYNEALFYSEKIIEQDTNKYRITNNIDRYINNCEFAIEALKSPVEFNPVNLGNNINSEVEEYLPAISVDGKTLVYSRRFMKNNVLQEDFFISEKNEDNSWAPSKDYGNNLNTYGNEGAFSFSTDKEMAVFTACDREGRMGSCDLYLLVAGKTYNAGKIINSKEWDSQGCFSPDSKYLYFVSSRKGGYGGKDIWRSEITKDGFLTPENLGPNINTKFDEMSPFLHPDNITLYFASNGHIGMGDYDIFMCRRASTINKWNKPENMGYPINTFNTENSLIVANNGKTAYYTSDQSGFGKEDIFQFELPENLQAEPLDDLEMDIITQKVGEEVILKNVSFASNSYALEKSSFVELEKLIGYLKKNPNLKIEIQGHTDDVGNEIDNQVLSKQRAKTVLEYLKIRISNSLSYKGFGESVPLESNTTKKGRAINRRTSFVIIQ